jgi:hypothetical protein
MEVSASRRRPHAAPIIACRGLRSERVRLGFRVFQVSVKTRLQVRCVKWFRQDNLVRVTNRKSRRQLDHPSTRTAAYP